MLDRSPALSITTDIVILLALGALTFFVPLLGGLCAFCSAVIVTIITCRRGALRPLVCLVLLAVFLIALSAAVSPVSAESLSACVLAALNLMLAGLAMGLMLRSGGGLYRIVGAGCAGSLAVMVLDLAKLRFLNGVNITEDLINTPIREFFELYRRTLAEMIAMTDELTEALNSMQWYMQQTLGAIMPAMLIAFSLLAVYAAFLTARKLLHRVWHITYPEVTHFWELQLGRATAAVMVAAQLLAAVSPSTNFGAAISNIVVVLDVAYMLCGVSVADFFFRRTGIFSIVRALVYVVVFAIGTILGAVLPFINLATLIMLIGLSDSLFDFRRLRQKGEPLS